VTHEGRSFEHGGEICTKRSIRFCSLAKYYWGDYVKEVEMNGEYRTYWGEEKFLPSTCMKF
jgi:hypothetical protein